MGDVELGGVCTFMPDKGRGCNITKGIVVKLQRAWRKVLRKMLDNFEVTVQIRVRGLPPIAKHLEEW